MDVHINELRKCFSAKQGRRQDSARGVGGQAIKAKNISKV